MSIAALVFLFQTAAVGDIFHGHAFVPTGPDAYGAGSHGSTRWSGPSEQRRTIHRTPTGVSIVAVISDNASSLFPLRSHNSPARPIRGNGCSREQIKRDLRQERRANLA